MTKILILCLALILVTQAVAQKNLHENSSQIQANGEQLYHNIESSSAKDNHATTRAIDNRIRYRAKLRRILTDIIKYEKFLANIRYTNRSFNHVRG